MVVNDTKYSSSWPCLLSIDSIDDKSSKCKSAYFPEKSPSLEINAKNSDTEKFVVPADHLSSPEKPEITPAFLKIENVEPVVDETAENPPTNGFTANTDESAVAADAVVFRKKKKKPQPLLTELKNPHLSLSITPGVLAKTEDFLMETDYPDAEVCGTINGITAEINETPSEVNKTDAEVNKPTAEFDGITADVNGKRTDSNGTDTDLNKNANSAIILPTVCIKPSNSNESLLLSVIEEESTDHGTPPTMMNRFADYTDVSDNEQADFPEMKSPTSRGTGTNRFSGFFCRSPTLPAKFPFTHRLSVPNLSPAVFRSASNQDIHLCTGGGTGTADADSTCAASVKEMNRKSACFYDQDDDFADKNSQKSQKMLKKHHRKASLSSLLLNKLTCNSNSAIDSTNQKEPRSPAANRIASRDRRVSLQDETSAAGRSDHVTCTTTGTGRPSSSSRSVPNVPLNARLLLYAHHSSSMMDVTENLHKNFSGSVPSVKDVCVSQQQQQRTKSTVGGAGVASNGQYVEIQTPVDAKIDSSSTTGGASSSNDEIIVPRNKLAKQGRTPSLFIPSVTPRLPLMGLLPGSIRRSGDKSGESKGKSKDKERKSFFSSRPKSKDGKQLHSWVRIESTTSSAAYCDICSKLLTKSDAFQCADCYVCVDLSCRDQSDKHDCPKFKNPKASKKSDTINLPDKPKHILERYSYIKDSFEQDTTMKNDDTISTASSASLNSEHNRSYPNGFYAATKPSSTWDELELWTEEPEAWSNSAGKHEKKKLSSKEIKKQDIIHEMYVTEKHHCQILVVLKHTYFDSIAHQKIFSHDDLCKLLPKLDDLLKFHEKFLRSLKERREEAIVVRSLHDILLEQFTGEMAATMVEAYKTFCAQKDATDRVFQKLSQNNISYQAFIKHLSTYPFYKSRSLRDCLLLVTQRLSKYHTFVENLRKNTPDDSSDKENMQIAEKAVKDVLSSVDAGIERIQLRQFCYELARDMDQKLFTMFNNVEFRPKDLISKERQLIRYANVQWPSAKRTTADVLMLLFSDIIVFLQNNGNGQYVFFSQDKKPAVVSLYKMIVRDKAGKLGFDGIYLIATCPKPEMYEIRCKTKKEALQLVNCLQTTIDHCPSRGANSAHILTKTPSIQSDTLLTGKENEELKALFDKLPATNDKLRSFINDLTSAYEEINDYLCKLSNRVKNNEDKEKISNIVNQCMESYMTTITPQAIVLSLAASSSKDRMLQQYINSSSSSDKESPSCLVSSEQQNQQGDETSVSSRVSSTTTTCTTLTATTTSSGNADSGNGSQQQQNSVVSRSNTFHGRVRNSFRRSLRKYPTISGIPEVDIRMPQQHSAAVEKVDVDESSCESVNDESSVSTDSAGFSAHMQLLKYLSDMKIEMKILRENNVRLECELAIMKEQLAQQQQQLSSKQQSQADTAHQTLEELRKVHASLNKKKADFAQMMEEREQEMKQRETALAEKEAKLANDDRDLRERWDKLYQAWEQKRLNGLNISPLAVNPNQPGGPVVYEFRRSNSVLGTSSMTQSFIVPGHLKGSLVHHGRLSGAGVCRTSLDDATDQPRSMLPSKLSTKNKAAPPPPQLSTNQKQSSTATSTSPNEQQVGGANNSSSSSSGHHSTLLASSFSRLNPIGRSSFKQKKWHSTSKLGKSIEPTIVDSNGSKEQQQQIIPNKLASDIPTKKK